MPFLVVISSFVMLVGISYLITAVRRYRRTHEGSWIVQSVTAAITTALAAASLVVYAVRH